MCFFVSIELGSAWETEVGIIKDAHRCFNFITISKSDV